ncbi:MAG TPA: hypothetical protein DCR97_08500 [Deltaproteobacteria bacterium]|nr:hypothetical protein [Deltaproteobacteria bacterium]
MVKAIDSSLAALSAFISKLSVIGGNVANCSAEGYKRRETTISGGNQGSSEISPRTVQTAGRMVQHSEGRFREFSNVDLNHEIPQMIIAQRVMRQILRSCRPKETC